MYLTKEILERGGACGVGKENFDELFPEGADIIDIINNPNVPVHSLHWGYKVLTTTPEQKAAYWARVGIECDDPTSIFESENIKNSKWVSKSMRVKNSSYIYSSRYVENSSNISFCKHIHDSVLIFGSDFVYNSRLVLQSYNINDSTNVVNSNYVINSQSIVKAVDVTDSKYVHDIVENRTMQIVNSRFISNCKNVKNCLFCSDIENAEFMLFNKSISERQFNIILRQLDDILEDWQFNTAQSGWPRETLPLEMPHAQKDVRRLFDALPDSFYDWVKTLPGYDSFIMFNITYDVDYIG